jgi:hypothetical protein
MQSEPSSGIIGCESRIIRNGVIKGPEIVGKLIQRGSQM